MQHESKAGDYVFWQDTMGRLNRVPVYKPRTAAHKTLDTNLMWFTALSLALLLTKIGAEALASRFLTH